MIEAEIVLHRLFLDLENPRHEELESEAQAIEALCKNELVVQLARDIVSSNAINPLEKMAVIKLDGDTADHDVQYVVLEGNRRLCALKLLNDPDLAPGQLKAEFHKLASSFIVPDKVSCVVFSDREAARPWLIRMHTGHQDGIGRKQWDSPQKERYLGGGRNRLALLVLDYAEKKGIIKSSERGRKLTTLQRHLSNPIFREELGIAGFNAERLEIHYSEQDFNTLLKKVLADIGGPDKPLNSRNKKPQFQAYAATLRNTDGISGVRMTPMFVSAPTARMDGRPSIRTSPATYRPRRRIGTDASIKLALRELGNYKLTTLYRSLGSIELQDHVLLLSVGVWSFFETLTAVIGRNNSNSFDSFLSNERLNGYGIVEADQKKAVRQALMRIHAYGNTTKHHADAANFNGNQLANDVDVLQEVILVCLQEANRDNDQAAAE